MAIETNEQFIHHITRPTDPVRVEIKENAKGEPQVAVRVTGTDPKDTMTSAITLYEETKEALEQDGQ